MIAYRYRVLMLDYVNGEEFNFAVFYNAMSISVAKGIAMQEFKSAYVVEVKRSANL
jgi:hypothetical protein